MQSLQPRTPGQLLRHGELINLQVSTHDILSYLVYAPVNECRRTSCINLLMGYILYVNNDSLCCYVLHTYSFFFFFFFNLTFTFFYRDASSALLQLVNQWLNFTYSRSHAFRYERKNTNPTLVRIELTTSALAVVQVNY